MGPLVEGWWENKPAMKTRDPDNAFLEALALDAREVSDWRGYAEYSGLRSAGLRRRALACLEGFLDETREWTDSQREAFVGWLCGRMEGAPHRGRDMCCPSPLTAALLRPTLLGWSTRDPNDPRPFRWAGMFLDGPSATAALRKAIELDPAEQPARVHLAMMMIGELDDATHNCPDWYSGDPLQGLALCDEADGVVRDIADEGTRRALLADIEKLRRRIADWIELRR